MDHKEILSDAVNTLKDRGEQYGNENELFERACSIYNLITGENMTPWQANIWMHSLKLARIKPNRGKADNYVDGINYLAFAGQFAQAKPGRVFVSAPTPLGPQDQVEEDIKRMAQMLAPVKKEEQE